MSASQTLAPEFRALMVIFLSTGPVISTRRSSRPGAGGATRQDGSLRMCSVSRQEPRVRAGGDLGPAGPPCLQQLLPPLRGGPVQLGDERRARPE